MGNKHKHHHGNADEMSAAKRRVKQMNQQIDSGGAFKPVAGATYEGRILETPPDRERDSPALFEEYMMHYNIGPNKRMGRCGRAPGETSTKPCWLCHSKIRPLIAAGKTKRANLMKQESMIRVQVALRDEDSGEMTGPLRWENKTGKKATSAGAIIRGLISSDRRDYTNMKRGYNFFLTRKGEGLNTEYSVDHADEKSKVPSEIIDRLKPFVDLEGVFPYNEQWLKDAYYGNDEKGDNMGAKKKGKKAEDESVDDVSSSDASSSSSDESSSDASSSSSDASASDTKSKKKTSKKKSKDDSDESSSDSSSSSSDSSSSSSESSASDSSNEDSDEEASDSDSSASGSDASASGSDASASGSDASASGSDASASSSDSEEEEKPRKRKKRSDAGKPRKTRKTKKTKRSRK